MGELTDLLFTIVGYGGKWFNSQGRRLCFIFWGICLIYWFLRNIQLGLCVQTLGVTVSFIINSYSYWNWKNKKIGE